MRNAAFDEVDFGSPCPDEVDFGRFRRYSDFSRDETEFGRFRRPGYSRDETEFGAFGDAACFGATPITVARPTVAFDQNALRGVVTSPTAVQTSLRRPTNVFDQNVVRGNAPAPAPAPTPTTQPSLASVMGQAAAGLAPKQVYVNPAAGSKDLLANMLAAVAANAMPNAPPLPASVTKQVGFTPFPLSSTPSVARIQVNPAAGTKNLLPNILATVARGVMPNAPPLPAKVTQQVQLVPIPLASTPAVQRATAAAPAPAASAPVAPSGAISTLGAAKARQSYHKVYTGAQQGGFQSVPVPSGPPRVQRASGAVNPVAPRIDLTGVGPFLTWTVNSQGAITEGPNPVDRSTPQWLVYGSGQVVRVG